MDVKTFESFMDKHELTNAEVAKLTCSKIRAVQYWHHDGIPEAKWELLKLKVKK